ncbi:hypothetical protein RI367_008505 [Sorochytrium milnesiophthora]
MRDRVGRCTVVHIGVAIFSDETSGKTSKRYNLFKNSTFTVQSSKLCTFDQPSNVWPTGQISSACHWTAFQLLEYLSQDLAAASEGYWAYNGHIMEPVFLLEYLSQDLAAASEGYWAYNGHIMEPVFAMHDNVLRPLLLRTPRPTPADSPVSHTIHFRASASPAASPPTARSTTFTSWDVIRLLAHDLASLEDAIARLNPATSTFDVEAGLAMLHSIMGLRRRLEATPQGPAPAHLEHFLAEVDNYLGLLCPQATDDYKIRVVVSFLDKGPLSWYRVSASARPIQALDYAVFLEALHQQHEPIPEPKTLEDIDKFEEATYLAPTGITEEMRATACRRSLLPRAIASLTQPHTLKNFADLIRAVTELGMQRAEVRSASRAFMLQHVRALRAKLTSDYPVPYLVEQQPADATSLRQLVEQQQHPTDAAAAARQPTAMNVDFLQGNQDLEDRVLCQKHNIFTPGHESPDCPVLHEDELKRANHTHDTELLKNTQAWSNMYMSALRGGTDMPVP